MAETNLTTLIANHDERSEAEPLAALHHLGDAVERHKLVDELALAIIVAVPISRGIACHVPDSFS